MPKRPSRGHGTCCGEIDRQMLVSPNQPPFSQVGIEAGFLLNLAMESCRPVSGSSHLCWQIQRGRNFTVLAKSCFGEGQVYKMTTIFFYNDDPSSLSLSSALPPLPPTRRTSKAFWSSQAVQYGIQVKWVSNHGSRLKARVLCTPRAVKQHLNPIAKSPPVLSTPIRCCKVVVADLATEER